jgi:hypothetical protein
MSLFFVIGSYGATGEGITVSMLVTKAYPKQSDFDPPPGYDENSKYRPGELKKSKEEIAIGEFEEIFGKFYSMNAQIVSQDDFFAMGKAWIPDAVKKSIESQPGNIKWFSQIHLNYS